MLGRLTGPLLSSFLLQVQDFAGGSVRHQIRKADSSNRVLSGLNHERGKTNVFVLHSPQLLIVLNGLLCFLSSFTQTLEFRELYLPSLVLDHILLSQPGTFLWRLCWKWIYLKIAKVSTQKLRLSGCCGKLVLKMQCNGIKFKKPKSPGSSRS